MHRRIRKSASDLEVVDEALLDAVPIMVLNEVEAVRGIKIEAPVDVLIVMETEGDDPILQLPLESVAPTWLINALCFATAFVLLSLSNSQQIYNIVRKHGVITSAIFGQKTHYFAESRCFQLRRSKLRNYNEMVVRLSLSSYTRYSSYSTICTRSKTGDNKALKPSAIRNRRQRVTNRIPDEILSDQRLTKAMETVRNWKIGY